jgi:epoxyqueuosine reductase
MHAAWLKEYALSLGFDDVGFASTREGTPYRSEFLQAIVEGRQGPLDYMERTAQERADVLALMPTAKSVMIVVKNYYPGDHPELKEGEAKVSRYAWGGDYHHWFKKRLRKMRSEIHARVSPEIKVHIFNDTGPVLERAWAERAGLGFIGKSAMFIHRRYGTWTFLGGLVTELELAPTKPSPRQMCGSCTACIDACPTGAIIGPRQVDARRCLTTWNVERPTHANADAAQLQGHGWAIGCDICQEACPWNKFENLTDEARFSPRPGQVVLRADQIPVEIQGTALARAGHEGLRLNVKRATR